MKSYDELKAEMEAIQKQMVEAKKNESVSASKKGDQFSGSKTTVAIVGAGYIGSVLAAAIADKGVDVIALDIVQSSIENIAAGFSPVREPGLDDLIRTSVASGKLRASADFSEVRNADVILVTVGTPLDDQNNPDMSGIESVVESLAPHIKDGHLVILKSTVPPFTTETHVAEPLRKHTDVMVAFCPERLSEGNAIEECQKIPIVVGGVDARSADAAMRFWRSVFEVDVLSVDSARAAELVKLADNAWIDLNIAIAFELAKLADKIGVDVLPVISAANSLPKGSYNVNILMPSVGVGGYCLTKDPWFLNSFAKRFNTEFKTAITSRSVNDSAPLYSAKRFQKRLAARFPGVSACDMRVAILGLSFKNNTGDCRFSPTIPFVNYLLSREYDLQAFDPWVAEEDWKTFDKVGRCEDALKALDGAHGVAYLAGHDEFYDLTADILAERLQEGAVIFDGRMFFSGDQIEKFRSKGLDYLGVGR